MLESPHRGRGGATVFFSAVGFPFSRGPLLTQIVEGASKHTDSGVPCYSNIQGEA
jgi:hypothetical protein